MAEPDAEKKSFHLPAWVGELALKTLYVVVPLLIIAAANLYIDNLNLKKDVAREIWRNDKQDVRQDRIEARLDKHEGSIAQLRDNGEEFQGEALHRLDILLEKEQRRRHR